MKLQELFEKKLTEKELLSASSHEIATFSRNSTKLESTVWICEIEGYSGPVLKISNIPGEISLKNNFIVSVSKNPQLLTPSTASKKLIEPALEWVKKHYKTLLGFWKQHKVGDGDQLPLYRKLKESSQLNEMANFYPKTTGVQYILWMGKAEQHPSSRIKVSNVPNTFAESFVVSISKSPEILEGESKIPSKALKKIYAWIELNYDVLMKMVDFFDKDIGNIEELISELKKIT